MSQIWRKYIFSFVLNFELNSQLKGATFCKSKLVEDATVASMT